MPDQIRVAVIDDHPIFRDGVIQTLEHVDSIEVAGVGASAQDAQRIAEDASPDVMLLDINMPGCGLTAAREIARVCPQTKVLFLTISEDQHHVHEALAVGAKGYVLKGVSGNELVRTIRAVHNGEVYITPSLAARILTLQLRTESQRAARSPYSDTQLNFRENQILELLAMGKTNREISAHIGLSESTVKRYLSMLLEKLEVRNRVEAALYAHKRLN